MKPQVLAGAALLAMVASGCSSSGDGRDARGTRGPFTAHQIEVATGLAHQETTKIRGDLIGAVAAVVPASAERQDRIDSGCPGGNLYRIRVVWSHANFTHGAAPLGEQRPDVVTAAIRSLPSPSSVGGPPDGPLQSILIYADLKTATVCSVGASYRAVGADPDEVLLYGTRPHDPTGEYPPPR